MSLRRSLSFLLSVLLCTPALLADTALRLTDVAAGEGDGLNGLDAAVLGDALPPTAIPGPFASYHDYRSYVDTLLPTNSIPDARRVYDLIVQAQYVAQQHL